MVSLAANWDPARRRECNDAHLHGGIELDDGPDLLRGWWRFDYGRHFPAGTTGSRMKPPLSMPDERAYWRSAICWGITVPLSGAVGDSCMSAFDALLTLKLSIQRALLGEVTDRL